MNTAQIHKIARNEIYNLQTRFVQFKNMEKAKNVHNSYN